MSNVQNHNERLWAVTLDMLEKVDTKRDLFVAEDGQTVMTLVQVMGRIVPDRLRCTPSMLEFELADGLLPSVTMRVRVLAETLTMGHTLGGIEERLKNSASGGIQNGLWSIFAWPKIQPTAHLLTEPQMIQLVVEDEDYLAFHAENVRQQQAGRMAGQPGASHSHQTGSEGNGQGSGYGSANASVRTGPLWGNSDSGSVSSQTRAIAVAPPPTNVHAGSLPSLRPGASAGERHANGIFQNVGEDAELRGRIVEAGGFRESQPSTIPNRTLLKQCLQNLHDAEGQPSSFAPPAASSRQFRDQ